MSGHHHHRRRKSFRRVFRSRPKDAPLLPIYSIPTTTLGHAPSPPPLDRRCHNTTITSSSSPTHTTIIHTSESPSNHHRGLLQSLLSGPIFAVDSHQHHPLPPPSLLLQLTPRHHHNKGAYGLLAEYVWAVGLAQKK
ncbi:hypothetical protein Tco_1527388, partial [Tanacetum coccineum]